MATLGNKVSGIIGDRTAKVLETTFGIKSVGDLLRHYPRRYMVRGELSDISMLQEGDETTILAQIYATSNRPLRGRKGSILEVVVTDGSDKISLTFFNLGIQLSRRNFNFASRRQNRRRKQTVIFGKFDR